MSSKLGALVLALAAPILLGGAPSSAQFWEVGNFLLADSAMQYLAHFGKALAVGDFDGDGIDDLAVGSPGWDSATADDVGAVQIYRGATDRTLELWWAPTSAGAGDLMGAALAAGDFDHDGRDELAIGRPGHAVFDGFEVQQEAGDVQVLGYDGDAWSGYIMSQLDVASEPAEAYDHFGETLAAGDFDNDLYADLAVAAPDEDGIVPAPRPDAGMVAVFEGSATGLHSPTTFSFAAGAGGVLGEATLTDFLGTALAAGDFDDDGYDDLAVGAPGRTIDAALDAGQVHVFYGSASGLGTAGQQLFDVLAWGWTEQENAHFGAALAAGDFDSSLRLFCISNPCPDELAIGIPGRNVFYLGESRTSAGSVSVLPGSDTGLSTVGVTHLTQILASDSPEVNDEFGAALAAGRVDPTPGGFTAVNAVDLVVGVPRENLYGLMDTGMAHLFLGSADGLAAGGDQEQAVPMRPGFAGYPAQGADSFGEVLAIGDFDDDGWGDLAVGLPYHDGVVSSCGAVQILYGALFADGFESEGTTNWDASLGREDGGW